MRWNSRRFSETIRVSNPEIVGVKFQDSSGFWLCDVISSLNEKYNSVSETIAQLERMGGVASMLEPNMEFCCPGVPPLVSVEAFQLPEAEQTFLGSIRSNDQPPSCLPSSVIHKD